MPAELAGYVTSQTTFKVIVRIAGDVNLLKRLIAAGFPVIVEKGFESPKFDGWMGHYELITGYDTSAKNFIAQDSYMGPDLQIPADTLVSYWRAFDFTYLLIYPMERQAEVAALLGSQMNEADNRQLATQKAADETRTLKGRDLYFGWFNLGSSLVALQNYSSAADAFDQAFAVYPSIPPKSRPWRMLWYQTGPYEAYYYSKRYQDVLDLATNTLDAMSEPVLEESYYWRALAKEASGDKSGALDDLQTSLKYHPGFETSIFEIQRLKRQP
jgi:tetratricopeptide (TPR) repeat protein